MEKNCSDFSNFKLAPVQYAPPIPKIYNLYVLFITKHLNIRHVMALIFELFTFL